MEGDQFDAALGGTEHLPFSANSLKFATSRSIEIAAMTENILRPSMTKLIFQTLPVHMRRRVMSHNCKRLPRKLREGHMEQLKKSGLPPKQKRPSRKYRRRPGNLLEEYNRRKKNNTWLETHIWHAKRFHMIQRWGYKIAYSPCDKAFRACYRASSAHCLMQDISYYVPIKIEGDIELIQATFKNITSSDCGLSVCSKAYLSGHREGTLHIFKPNLYPFGYIGKVHYLWELGDRAVRTLWLFVHPSFIQEVKELLNVLFNENDDKANNIPQKRQRLSEENTSLKIHVTFCDNSFNIFRLTGPNSHSVLCNSLKCLDNIEKIKTNDWIATHFANSAFELRLDEKFKYWSDIKLASSPSQLPSRLVLGLIVRDPRLSRPKHRTKACCDDPTAMPLQSLISVPDCAAHSPLWNINIHNSIKNKRLSNTQFIERVTKSQLIPGEVFEEDPELQSVPVVLIQRNGSQNPVYKKVGFGSGWDIIIPSGYGLPFWQTFTMFGARAGGLRETEHLSFEMGECYLPPDTEAGKGEENRIEQELKNKYFKLPPSKRVNYNKLGINSPFRSHWKILLNDWSDSIVDDFYVLRDLKLLTIVQDCVDKKSKLPKIANSNSCLIPIYVHIVQKGSLKVNAVICLPKPGDVQAIKSLIEPLHKDNNEQARKLLRKEHKKSIKLLRRKRMRRRDVKLNGTQLKLTKRFNQEPSEYVKKMRELWLPSSIQHVRNSCSRDILGYLSQAGFSFSEAHSCGVGYVPYNALDCLILTRQNCVLLRNTSSRNYTMGTIQIIKT